MNVSKLIAKLRSKYPELEDEPMLDQLAPAADPEMAAEPMPGEGDSDAEMFEAGEMPMEEEAPMGEQDPAFGGDEAEDELKAKKKGKRFKAPPMPDLDAEGTDEPAAVNGPY